jgi:hypothetical protein
MGVAVLMAGLILFVGATSAQQESTGPEVTTAKSSQNRVAAQAKVATKTFSNATPISISDLGQAAPYPSEISVGRKFGKRRILDVNLVLKNFDHDFEEHVDVLLVKAGTNRTVMSDVAAGSGGPPSPITLVLNDEAANSLPATGVLTGGTFKPTNRVFSDDPVTDTFPAPAPTASGQPALSGFDGKRARGTWKLFVVDDEAGGVGQFAGSWSIKIKAKLIRR